MQALIIQLCVFAVFVQIGSEHLNNASTQNKLIKNDNHNLPQTNKTEPYKNCILKEIIRKIEEILISQIKESGTQIKFVLKPQENSSRDPTTNTRKVRNTENSVDWNKCALKSELEQHRNLETEHILAIKKELEKLQELVRLLRDQQYVLNMLTDFEKPRPKTDDEDNQKQLMELFKMLRNNLPAQAKMDEVPLPPQNPSHDDFQKIMTEISKLQKQVENQNISHETKLKTELVNQKTQLQTLENEIENLRNGQAIFFNVNRNQTSPDIVGAKPPQNHPSFAKFQPKTKARKASSDDELKSEIENLHKRINKKSDTIINPKVRAGNDDFLENLQKILLENPEQNPETKENPFDLNIIPNTDMENRLDELEKQLKISEKMKQLEKKIKQIHQTNAESKNIDDEDEDLRSQMKKLQKQLNSMNKSKGESKSLDEEDVLDELKNLQNAINDLKPKEDTSQSKIGGAEIQLMLNKLIGVPVRPVVATPTHSQLTPTQIQVLRRIMALKAGSNQHFSQPHVPSTEYGFGLDATPGSGYVHSNGLYNHAYSLYGQGSNSPYDGFYANPQQSGSYNQGPYGIYDSGKQFYGGPSAFYPGREDGQHSFYEQYSPYSYPSKYAYSIGPYSGPSSGHYGSAPTRGGYSSNGKYGQANIAQYLFGAGPHLNNGQYKPNRLENYYSPNSYGVGNEGYGHPGAGYYGPIPHANNQQYTPKNIYAGGKINGALYRPSVQYKPSPGGVAYNKYDGNHAKAESSNYPTTYGNNFQTTAGTKYKGTAIPRPNGYEEQQFFPGYKDNDSTDYQSDSPKFYSNSQENSYPEDSYSQQKMGELQTQIYTLQNVINNLNSPEYVQKPEDHQTIYELDHKISDLKGIVNNLAQDTNQAHYEPGYNAEHADEGSFNYRSDSNAYSEDSPKSKRSRFRRDATNSTDNSIIKDFFQQLSEIVSVINFLSENLSEAYNTSNANNTRSVRDSSKISNPSYFNNLLNIVKQKRVTREANNTDDTMDKLYRQLNKLMNFVDDLTTKIVDHHETCANGENCADSNNHKRNKRDTEDSDETDNAMQRIWDAMSALLGTADTDNNEPVNNEIQKETESERSKTEDTHGQRYRLEKQLDHLKQQLDSKLRTNTNFHSFGHNSHNPQLRSSYYQPLNYYRPGYYQQPYYSQPIYYQTVYDYDDKEKKDKTKKIKLKKELKKESKFDKIFTKILEKIIDKVIKAIPIVIRKLLGLELDIFGDGDDGYNNGYNYGVQKDKKKFGIFSIIPMLIFKIFSNIGYFVKKLKKNTFIKTFLVPGFVTIATAGLVVFLVWWLSGDDSKDYGNYGYGGNIGYDNSYRNSNNNAYDDDYNNEDYGNIRSRSSQNFAKPLTDYSSQSSPNNNYKNPNVYYNPYTSFYNKYPPNRYDPFIQKSNKFDPIRYY